MSIEDEFSIKDLGTLNTPFSSTTILCERDIVNIHEYKKYIRDIEFPEPKENKSYFKNILKYISKYISNLF